MRKILAGLLMFILTTSINIASAAPKLTKPALSFDKVIVPEAPPVASVMVAYMHIKNNSNTTQTITEITSPQFQRVEIHEMSMANGMMDMKQIKALSIKPKQTIALETGGLHIMLIKPVQTLKHDDHIEITFTLASGELTTINTTVSNVDLTNSHQHH